MDPRQAAVDALKDFERQEAERQAERIEDQRALAVKRKKRKALKVMAQCGLIVFCLGIIGYQFPKLVATLSRHDKPLRRGTMATDEATDRCIVNLWAVSKRLQEGKPVGGDLVCPASGKPFVIETVGDDLVARSPAPERYGFREIRVSKKKPVPELVR